MADLSRTDADDLSGVDKIEATRSEIEHTRGDMAETLNAIKDKLDPKALMDQAKDRVEDVATKLADKAKETVHDVTADLATQAKSTVHTLAEDVSGHAKEAAHNAVSGVVDDAKDKVSNVVHSAQEKVGGVMDNAKGASSSVVGAVKSNPVPSALIALGAAWLYFKNRDDGRGSRPNRSGYRDDFDVRYSSTGASGSTRYYADQDNDRGGNAADAVGDAVQSAKDKAGDVLDGAKGAGLSIIDTIERNPIPAAATALGLVWLFLKNADENKARQYDRESYSYSDHYNRGGDAEGGHGVVDTVKEKAGQVGDAFGSAVDTVKEKAGQVGDAVGGAVGTVKDKAGQVSQQVGDRAGELRSQAMDRTRDAGGFMARTLQENPLPIGMVALGIGAAVGLMMPNTDRENQMMGQVRDRLVDKAQDTAQDIAHKVQAVAGETMDAAKQTVQNVAKDQGLVTP